MKTSGIITLFMAILSLGIVVGCASQPTQATTAPTPMIVQGAGPAPPMADNTEPVDPPVEDNDPAEDLLFDPFDDPDGLDDDFDFQMVADPLEPFNRAMFYLNDKLYFWVFKPLATGYRTVTPTSFRIGMRNFFTNLLAPVRVVNNILQGKGQSAEAEFAKFIYNSTVGVLGFGNPSKAYPALNPEPQDLGQTLGRYGIGEGFYIVWPVLGASTLRDSLGNLGDGFINPVSYVEPIEAYLTVQGFSTINNLSFYLGDYDSFKKAALDPYLSMRDAYIQLRRYKIEQ